jgi:rhodanese-related sulfurtransferase
MALGTCAAQPRTCFALRRAQLRRATRVVPSAPARRSRAVARPARAKAGEEEPEYLFGVRLPRGLRRARKPDARAGLNDSGRRKGKPEGAWETFWFNYYFAKPKQSELEKQLQAFADSKFRGLRNWKEVFVELRKAGTKSLAPDAAAAAMRGGGGPLGALFGGGAATLLDVREPEVYAKAHASGAVNVPLYSPMEAPQDAFDRLRQVYFSLFGLRVPVRNDDFVAQVQRAVGGRKDAPIIVMCQTGGTLETAAERKVRAPNLPGPVYGKFGAASRSLMAAHELQQAGFTRVSHAEGGFSRWRASRDDVEASS